MERREYEIVTHKMIHLRPNKPLKHSPSIKKRVHGVLTKLKKDKPFPYLTFVST